MNRPFERRLMSLAITKTTGISDKSITNQQLADESITYDKIKAGTIISANIGLMTIQGLNIASNTIQSWNISDGSIEPKHLVGVYNITIPFCPINLNINVRDDVSFYGTETTPYMTKYSYPTAYNIYALSMMFDSSVNATEATLELLMESVRGIQAMGLINIPLNDDKLAYSLMLPSPIYISQNTTLQVLHTYLRPKTANMVRKVRYIFHGATA